MSFIPLVFVMLFIYGRCYNPKVHIPYRDPSHIHRGRHHEAAELGAIMMLVKNWRESRGGRKCYFNASMNAITEHWRPNNPYTVVLMDTEPWKLEDMKAIRTTWHLLDFRFINIGKVWNSMPKVPESEFEDAAKPIGPINYKRMCHFFFKGFTDVSVLMEYKYLMRLDDDTCFQDNINFDVFQYLARRDASYAYSHTVFDYPGVIKGLYAYVQNYAAVNNLAFANEELYNATIHSKRGPGYPPAYNTNFEVINTVRYREEPVMKFLTAVSESNMIFHRRWGDAPLRFALGLLFWSEADVVRLDRFGLQHSTWPAFNMSASSGSSLPEDMPPYKR